MKTINIDDLPKYTRWVHRILGIEHFEPKVKNEQELLREYEEEKWGPILDKLIRNNDLNLEKLDKEVYSDKDLTCVYYNKNFHIMTPYECYKLYLDLICKTISPYCEEVRAIVELGSGYGNISLNVAKRLNLLKKNMFLGEFSLSGVKISKILAAREGINIEAGQCNFFNLDLSSFQIPEDSLFFTSYALISIPKMPTDFLDRIMYLKPKYIIVFEPCKELYDLTTLFGMLKSRYIELNDYNRNIYSYFTSSPYLQLVKMERNIIGSNPLLPISVLVFQVKI